MLRLGRRALPEFRPASRCKLCGSRIPGLTRLVRWWRGRGSAPLCRPCLRTIARGCEREVSIVFADVRGSTALAERLTPTAFSGVMRRFYARATAVVGGFDGTVDKFVGDGVVALFLGCDAGDHARRAVDAAHALVASMEGGAPGSRPWPPVAVGVHTGTAWLGLIPGPHGADDLTALGDSVNVAAHLCSAAGAGEVAISNETWSAAGVTPPVAPRSLRLKRRRRPIAARFSDAALLGRLSTAELPRRRAAATQSCFAADDGAAKSLRYSPYPSASSLSTGMKRSAAELMQ
jgi:adenylate cyclase